MSDPKPRIQLSCEQGAFAAYADAVTAAGGLPCPGYAPQPDLSCAGLVLCGGGDLDPDMFGWPQAGGDPPDRVRDLAEVNLFRAFYLAGRPILGICRGMQVIAAAQGGGLIQDLPPEQCVFHKGTKRDDATTRCAPCPAPCWSGCMAPFSTPTASTTRRWPTPALA